MWSVASLQSVTVTPAMCPRMFEILTTLTFRVLGRNRIVSTAIETIEKKKQGRLVVHMRSANFHEVSRTQPKSEGKCVTVGVNAVAVAW